MFLYKKVVTFTSYSQIDEYIENLEVQYGTLGCV